MGQATAVHPIHLNQEKVAELNKFTLEGNCLFFKMNYKYCIAKQKTRNI
jgi:hypothetical protein